MPIYLYKCVNCGEVEERIERLNSVTPVTCLACRSPEPMEKQPTAAALAFKGSGWTPKGPGRRQ